MNPLTSDICSWLGNAPLCEINAINAGFAVQLHSIKKTTARALDRYWIAISDGKCFVQATLARRLHNLVTNKKITKNSVIAIDGFTCCIIQSKRIFIILDLRVISRKEKRIGNPIPASPPPVAARPGVTSPTLADEALHSDIPDLRCVPVCPTAQGRWICSIKCLDIFMRDWTIRARVTGKSDIRPYHSGGGGWIFTVTLVDESEEIGGVGFNGAVDAIYDKLVPGNVYYISQARMVEAKEKLRAWRRYELRFDKDTKVEKCLEPTSIPINRYNFIPIASLGELQPGSYCDVIGILKDIGPLKKRVCTTIGGTTTNRHINIVDKSQHVVRVTLWEKLAERFLAEELSVVALKTVRVEDFRGRSLEMIHVSAITVSPDIEEARLLRQWYDAVGAKATFHFYPSTWVL